MLVTKKLAKAYGLLVERDEFIDTMREAGSLAMPNYDLADLALEPHYVENEQFVDLAGTALTVPKSPVSDFGIPVALKPAPKLGEADSLLDTLRRAGSNEAAPLASDASKLLDGVRIIELSWVLAGPIGGCMLADFGADVIRVESRARLDGLRNHPLPDGTRNTDILGLFNCVNTSKRSLTLDLTKERSTELLRDLMATADLVINNYSVGSLARMGLDFESLSERNPKLSMVHMPGCGTRGRWSKERTMGNLLMAASGINSLMGFEGREPRGVGVAYPDFIAPHMLVTMSVAALRTARRQGKGRELTIDQLGSTVALMGAPWLRFNETGALPKRPGNRSFNFCPHGVYPTAGDDKWVAVAAADQSQWEALTNEMGRPELASDPRFATYDERKVNEDELDAILTGWTAGQDRWDLAERLQSKGIPAAAVEELRDTVEADPQLARHYQRIRQPSMPDFEIIVDAEPIRLAGDEHIMERAPGLGEHSEAVLRDILGLTMEQFDELVVDGIVN